jgi:hypothetical protein
MPAVGLQRARQTACSNSGRQRQRAYGSQRARGSDGSRRTRHPQVRGAASCAQLRLSAALQVARVGPATSVLQHPAVQGASHNR